MRITVKHPGSNSSFVEDARRDSVSRLAVTLLEVGKGATCVSADHLGGETCIDCIVRLGSLGTKTDFNPVNRNTVLTAVRNLKEGVGVNAVAATHTGGNTCAATIAGIDDTY
jgi:hypothetical protein